MANVVAMPQLGNPTGPCLVTSWRVRPGDRVTPTTIVAVIETDKSSMEVPSGVEGTVVALLAQEGDEIPVGGPFFVVSDDSSLEEQGDTDMDPSLGRGDILFGDSEQVESTGHWEDIDDHVQASPEPIDHPPLALGLDPAQVEEEHMVEQPPEFNDDDQVIVVPQVAEPQQVAEKFPVATLASVSPRARRMAEQLGVDLSRVVGTGPQGRILVPDVEAAVQVTTQAISDQSSGGPLVEGTYDPDLTDHHEVTDHGVGDTATDTHAVDFTEQGEATEYTNLPDHADQEGQVEQGDQLAHDGLEDPLDDGEPIDPGNDIDHGHEEEHIDLTDPDDPSDQDSGDQGDSANQGDSTEPIDESNQDESMQSGENVDDLVENSDDLEQETSEEPAGVEITDMDQSTEDGPYEDADSEPIAESTTSSDGFPGVFTETLLSPHRLQLSQHLKTSQATQPQFTMDMSASAQALLSLRERLKNGDESLGMNGVTIGDLVSFAAVKTLSGFQILNSTVNNNVVRTFDAVHLGYTVDTPQGLVVPTLKWASSLGLRTFSAQAKALSDQARDGSLDLHSAGDATFTVTNLGAYGIESFTPILNTPQVAILGINAIMVKPVMGKDSAMNLEQRITFSLTVDHAVIDGGTAARYLQALVAYIENIDLAILAEGSPYG